MGARFVRPDPGPLTFRRHRIHDKGPSTHSEEEESRLSAAGRWTLIIPVGIDLGRAGNNPPSFTMADDRSNIAEFLGIPTKPDAQAIHDRV